MKQFDKWVFPDKEEHLQDWMRKVSNVQRGRLSYQFGKYDAALKLVKQRRVALDIGSHVGLWAFHMAHDFETVQCFEPMPEHAECWEANMIGLGNAHLHKVALGNEAKMVSLRTRSPNSSGDTGVAEGEAGDTPMALLDYYDYDCVDFIKIDCEGYETHVLRGAVKTLIKNKPVIVVEQKGNMSRQYGLEQMSAVKYLESLGAVKRGEISGDYIMAWS